MAIDIFSGSTYGALISEVNKKIKDILIDNPRVILVEELPKADIIDGIIYLIPAQDPETENIYDEWVHVNNKWEFIGNKKIDLSDYVTQEYLSELIEAIEDDLKELREGKVDKDLGNIDEDGAEKIKEIISDEGYLKPDADGYVHDLKALGDVEVQNGTLKIKVQNGTLKISDTKYNSIETDGYTLSIKDSGDKLTRIRKSDIIVTTDETYSAVMPDHIVENGKNLDEQYAKIDNTLSTKGGTLQGGMILDGYYAGLMSQPINGLLGNQHRFLVRTGRSNQDFAIFLAQAKEGEAGTKPQHYDMDNALSIFRIGYMGDIELTSKHNVNILANNAFKATANEELDLIGKADVKIIGWDNVFIAQDNEYGGDINDHRNAIGFSVNGTLNIKCLDETINLRGKDVKLYSNTEIKLYPGSEGGNTPGIDPVKTGNIKGSRLQDGTKPTITNFSDIHSVKFEENGVDLEKKYAQINNLVEYIGNVPQKDFGTKTEGDWVANEADYKQLSRQFIHIMKNYRALSLVLYVDCNYDDTVILNTGSSSGDGSCILPITEHTYNGAVSYACNGYLVVGDAPHLMSVYIYYRTSDEKININIRSYPNSGHECYWLYDKKTDTIEYIEKEYDYFQIESLGGMIPNGILKTINID